MVRFQVGGVLVETLVRTEEDVVRFPNRLPTASGMGSFKRNDTVSKQSDSHKADFLSLEGTTTFKISSVIDPDSWNLVSFIHSFKDKQYFLLIKVVFIFLLS